MRRRLAVWLLALGAAHGAPLSGNLRPGALRQVDLGRMEADFPLPALTLMLQPKAAQKSGLAAVARGPTESMVKIGDVMSAPVTLTVTQ